MDKVFQKYKAYNILKEILLEWSNALLDKDVNYTLKLIIDRVNFDKGEEPAKEEYEYLKKYIIRRYEASLQSHLLNLISAYYKDLLKIHTTKL